MQNKEVDVIKFEDWVNKELGEDMVRELKTNCYINYGPIKYIFEHFFVNLYHPKFVKIVKMNLDLKQTNETDTDERLTELKLKNKKLKAKISEMKSSCEEVELDMKRQYESFYSDLQASQANEAYMRSKITDNLIQTTFLAKARQYANKFRIAAKRLSLISDGREPQGASESLLTDSRFGRQLEDGDERTERSMRIGADKEDASRKLKVYETLLLNFQQNQNNVRNDMSRLQQLDLIECLNMLSRKLDTDQSQITANDLKSIVNDIMLVLYKIDPNFSRIENLLNDLRQNGDDTSCLQLISKCSLSKEKEYAKFLEQSCQIKHYMASRRKVLSKQRFFFLQLQEFLAQSYSKQDASMYMRFLKTHNKMRLSDQNLIELQKTLEEFDLELADLKRSFVSVQEKQNKYKQLCEIIGRRQLELVNLVNENKRLCSIHNNDNTAKHLLRNSFDNVLDLMHAIKTTNLKPLMMVNQSNLTMPNMTLNESRASSNMSMSRGNEICLGKELDNYRAGIFGSRPAPSSLMEANKRALAFLNKKSYLFGEILKQRPFKSNSFVIEQLYEMFNLMQRELTKMDSKLFSSSLDMLNDSQSVAHLVSQSKKLLDRCQEIDRTELRSYSNEMEEMTKKCIFMKDNMDKLEKLVDMWAKQPGAYDCHLKNLTVNGRNLKHYYDMVQEKLADLATRNKMLKL